MVMSVWRCRPIQEWPSEVAEAEFLLHLLVGLLADPSRLDGGCQFLEARVGWKVRQVVLALTGTAVLAGTVRISVRWRAVAPQPAMALVKRSPNWALAIGQGPIPRSDTQQS